MVRYEQVEVDLGLRLGRGKKHVQNKKIVVLLTLSVTVRREVTSPEKILRMNG